MAKVSFFGGADTKRDVLKIERNFSQAINGFKREMRNAMFAGGKIIMERSLELTPIDTGDLRKSSFIEVDTTSDPLRATLILGYDKALELRNQYAIIVHEDLNARHEAPTQAKFLQQAVQEKADEAFKEIAKVLAASLRGKK